MLPILMETELPIPVIGFFVIPFVIFMVALGALLLFGSGRQHS